MVSACAVRLCGNRNGGTVAAALPRAPVHAGGSYVSRAVNFSIPDAIPTLAAVEVLLTERGIVVHPRYMSRRARLSLSFLVFEMSRDVTEI